MKKFILITESESGDNYYYLIKHPKTPTSDELDIFLENHANDKDEECVYEYVEKIIELKNEYLTIPK